MSTVKHIANEQHRALVNRAAEQFRSVPHPRESWLSLVRHALGMSAAQLARRLGVTRAHISKTEKAELLGGVTLKTMHNFAEGMGCRFVYAIVPENTVEDILAERAGKKAQRIVEVTNKHMALEDQSLSSKAIAYEIERLQKDMLNTMPSDFWNDEA